MIKFPFRKKKTGKKIPMLHETYMDKVISKTGFSVGDGEGRLEHVIPSRQLFFLGFIFIITIFFIILRVSFLQIVNGDQYQYVSEKNTLDQKVAFPIRGDILDRNGEKIAWNIIDEETLELKRKYLGPGFSSLLGFIRYPRKDSSGIYYRNQTAGVGGLEETYDYLLSGGHGSLVLEKDASGEIISELHVESPVNGENVKITIDSTIQESLYKAISTSAIEKGFQGGAGVIIDINTGEIISLVSYPDYDNNILTNHSQEERDKYLEKKEDEKFIHRGISGLYIPGSTVKPFFAVAGLEEGIIKPSTTIISNGKITLQNPYDPDITYVYKDWKALGTLDLYGAIAWSSNVYFYHVGGGYAHIKNGLRIDRINRYAKIFGFNKETTLGTFTEPTGLVPSPEWKENRYGESWTIGDTYNTVIGQYSFQVTPLQMARAVAAIANNGYMIEPHFELDKESKKVTLTFDKKNLEVVRTAMRKTITDGTGGILRSKDYNLAVKTGTAQIGNKGLENSLLTGFFPHTNPKYAFVIVMERGKVGAGLSTAKKFFDDIAIKKPDFLK